MKRIIARPTVNNGVKCWRIIIPKDIRVAGEKVRRYFQEQAEAVDFAREIEGKRGDIMGHFLAMPTIKRIEIMQALQVLNWDTGALLKLAQGQLAAPAPVVAAYAPAAPMVALPAAAPVAVRSIAAVVDECLASKKSAMRERSYSSLSSTLKRFAVCIMDASGKLIAEISKVTAVDIERWLNGNGWSDGTRKGYITDVRTFFSWCVAREYLAKSPALAVSKPKVNHAERKRDETGVHTPEQAKLLLDTALATDPGLIGVLALGYFGANRPDEAPHLKEEWFREKDIAIPYHISKTERTRYIPYNPTLKAWLKAKGKVDGEAKGIDYQPTNLKRRMETLRWIAGGKKMLPNGERDLHAFPWPHDVLRHSFCSYGVEIWGKPTVATWSGNSEAVLDKHYLEAVEPETVKAYWALRP